MGKKVMFFLLLVCLFPLSSFAYEKQEVDFSRCVDGDTAEFIWNDEKIKIRFLAIDTPETKHPTKGEEAYGKEASNYTCTKLEKATKIEIEFDDNSDLKDKYNRYLAWIFVEDSLLQDELVSKGYAKVAYLYGDYKYTSILNQSEEKAKQQKLGIWSEEEPSISREEMIIIAIIIIILLIIFIVNKKFRKKTISQVKRKSKSYINKEFKKLLK